jgi:hypothetical protein
MSLGLSAWLSVTIPIFIAPLTFAGAVLALATWSLASWFVTRARG